MGNTITGKPVVFIVAHTMESQLAREKPIDYLQCISMTE